MQRLEVSGAVRPIYGSLGVKGIITIETSRCGQASHTYLRSYRGNEKNVYVYYTAVLVPDDLLRSCHGHFNHWCALYIICASAR